MTLAQDRAPVRNIVVSRGGSARLRSRIGAGLAAAVLAAALASPAAAIDRRVRIVNDSTHNIVRFLAANVDRPDAMDNLLGDDILPAGGSLVLNFEDGSGYCRYRFRAEFEDGMSLARDSVNICEVGTYRYTD